MGEQINSLISKTSVASLLFHQENLWTKREINIKLDPWSWMRDGAVLSGILIFWVFVVCQSKIDTLSRVLFFYIPLRKDDIKTFISIYDNGLHLKCGTNWGPPLIAVWNDLGKPVPTLELIILWAYMAPERFKSLVDYFLC